MTDITITTSGEFMVAQLEGETDAGNELIDAYVPSSDGRTAAEFVVVDAGRIIIHTDDLDAFLAEARERGLVCEIEKAAI